MEQHDSNINTANQRQETQVSPTDMVHAYLQQATADAAAIEQLSTLSHAWAKDLLELAKLEAKQTIKSTGKLLSLYLLALFFGAVFYISLVIYSVIGASALGYSLFHAFTISILLQALCIVTLYFLRQRNRQGIGFHYTHKEIQKAYSTVAELLKTQSNGTTQNE